MPDLLVRLYDLPQDVSPAHGIRIPGLVLRAPMAHEKIKVVEWVRANFGDGWASECDIAFCRQPICCIIAADASGILGFSCWEVAAKGFFGPMGVVETSRRRGVGGAILLKSLRAMESQGYAYAVIGGVGIDSAGFYSKIVDCMEILGSSPGIYADRLS